MTDFSTPLQSDAEKLADFWVQRNKAAAEARKKIDRNSIPSLDGIFRANDEVRAKERAEAATQERPYAWTGQGMRFPVGSPFAKSKAELINGTPPQPRQEEEQPGA